MSVAAGIVLVVAVGVARPTNSSATDQRVRVLDIHNGWNRSEPMIWARMVPRGARRSYDDLADFARFRALFTSAPYNIHLYVERKCTLVRLTRDKYGQSRCLIKTCISVRSQNALPLAPHRRSDSECHNATWRVMEVIPV